MSENAASRALFRTLDRRLAPNGVALVQTIAWSGRGATDPWLERTMFPGSYVPTLSELAREAERHKLRIAHVENLEMHYALTLRHWPRALFWEHEREIEVRYGLEFRRSWEMSLTMLVPTSESLSTELLPIVVTKGEGSHHRIGITRYGAP